MNPQTGTRDTICSQQARHPGQSRTDIDKYKAGNATYDVLPSCYKYRDLESDLETKKNETKNENINFSDISTEYIPVHFL